MGDHFQALSRELAYLTAKIYCIQRGWSHWQWKLNVKLSACQEYSMPLIYNPSPLSDIFI